jgi:membrane-associated phospholipid phosphatase
MVNNEKILQIQKLMLINESITPNLGVFNNFDLTPFKDVPPPADNSEKTKNELKFLATIDLDKRFVQKKDDIEGNFTDFLKKMKLEYPKEKLIKIHKDTSHIVSELKNFYKRPRPFRLNKRFNDKMLESMSGFAYPSGHSTHAYLFYFILSRMYPKYEDDFFQITKDIVYSRQMAKAHYPSDIRMGKKLAKSLFDFLVENDVI